MAQCVSGSHSGPTQRELASSDSVSARDCLLESWTWKWKEPSKPITSNPLHFTNEKVDAQKGTCFSAKKEGSVKFLQVLNTIY